MAFNHIAIAVTNLEANHRFWTEAMGFTLVQVLDITTGVGDGWARQVFYDTGDGSQLSLLHLRDETVGHFDPAISRGLGLPAWVNHFAFDAPDAAAFDAAKQRWLALGMNIMRIDHGPSVSIYTEDPNGNSIEWCMIREPFPAFDHSRAEELLFGPRVPHPGPAPHVEIITAP